MMVHRAVTEPTRRLDGDQHARRRIHNVFVLATGRSGTMTFARACGHIAGFSAGHETRSQLIGGDRFDYPPDHIEVDNRLSWFLGELAHRWTSPATLFVHLRRNRNEVVRSFERRWDSTFPASIIRAFGHGIVARANNWSNDERREVCEFYVDTVNRNIAEFVRGRNSMTIELEHLHDQFGMFVDRLDTTADMEGARREIATAHNASD